MVKVCKSCQRMADEIVFLIADRDKWKDSRFTWIQRWETAYDEQCRLNDAFEKIKDFTDDGDAHDYAEKVLKGSKPE